MSKWHMQKITCPKCGRESDFKVWSSINTVIDPDMKEKVRNLEAFRFVCPHCGADANVNYGFLYHQMEDHIMIYYVTDEESFKTACEMLSSDYGLDGKAADLGIRAMKGYTNRVVTEQSELLEKITIFDAGLDDRVVEIMKVIFHVQMQQEHSGTDVDRLYFYQDENGRFGIQFVKEGKVVATAGFERKLYEQVAEDFGSKIRQSGLSEISVNSDWALEILSGGRDA